MEPVDLIVKFITPVLTLIIAGAAVWIAWQQFETVSHKFRLDLYDKRYAVYRGLMNLLAKIIADGEATKEALAAYYRSTDEKRFLFGDDIITYLQEVREKAVKLSSLRQLIHPEGQVSEKRRSDAIEENVDLLAWFDMQSEEAQRKFYRYLAFTNKL